MAMPCPSEQSASCQTAEQAPARDRAQPAVACELVSWTRIEVPAQEGRPLTIEVSRLSNRRVFRIRQSSICALSGCHSLQLPSHPCPSFESPSSVVAAPDTMTEAGRASSASGGGLA
jgi:hypothetical protein